MSYYFSSHFLKGTTISGIDCNSKTATQVKKKIQKQLGQYKLRIAELDGKTETIQATQIDLTYVDDNKVDELLKNRNSGNGSQHSHQKDIRTGSNDHL